MQAAAAAAITLATAGFSAPSAQADPIDCPPDTPLTHWSHQACLNDCIAMGRCSGAGPVSPVAAPPPPAAPALPAVPAPPPAAPPPPPVPVEAPLPPPPAAPQTMSPGPVSTWPGGVAADCANAVYAAHYNFFCATAPGGPYLLGDDNPYENGTPLDSPVLKGH